MAQQNNKKNEISTLSVNNCGLYVKPTSEPIRSPSADHRWQLDSNNRATAVAAEQAPQPAAATTAKKAVSRCLSCGKRVGLTGFRCRCGDLFCGDHRYSDRHHCTFDYKGMERQRIQRQNPVVRAPKIVRI